MLLKLFEFHKGVFVTFKFAFLSISQKSNREKIKIERVQI